MSFYTSAHRFGNKILFRGYDAKGNRIHKRVPFKPTFYLPSKTHQTDWKALDGTSVEPFELEDMSEAQDFVKRYEDVGNFKVYGNNNFVAQFLAKAYPEEIDYKLKYIRIGNIDIEVASDDGFPHPDEAAHPIISIAYRDNQSNVFHVWGLDSYDASKTELDTDALIQYRKCESEGELIQKFLIFWQNNTPDIITGWNIRLFDIPYMINRTLKVCGDKTAKLYSPWGINKHRQIGIKGKSMDAYEIYGVSQMDYYDLVQKFGFSLGPQESYSLDHIAHVVLGERKLSYEEHGSLHSLYKADHQKFIDYNIRDVDLVDRIDKQLGLMELALVIAYKGGVNYPDVFGTTAIWDSIIYRYLNLRNIAVPPNIRTEKDPYPGGYVKEPRIGKTEWVCSFDLNSLYPNLIVQYNMSPETLLRNPNDKLPGGVDFYLRDGDPLHPANRERNIAVAANGSTYRKDKRGVLPTIIIDLYDERRTTKKKMLETQQENEKNPSAELKREINRLDNTQMAVKILLNSLYGALGNQYFRYFEMEIAEGITLSGQLSIKWAEKTMNNAMNKVLKTENEDYVIAIDTDSIYVDMGPLVKTVNPSDPVKFLDKACEEKFVPILAKGYDDLFQRMNGYENRMVMAREVIADKAVWVAKKRYIMNVHNNEGVQYAEPKVKMMGLEAVKSSTPQVVRDKFKKAYAMVLTGTEGQLQAFVSDFYEEFKTLPAEDVSFPRGVSEIDKWADRNTIYKKGCPIHVRGALLFNKKMKDVGLDRQMEAIKNGSKVKFCYLKTPNPMMENVVAFPQFLPKQFELQDYIDYDTQFEKAFKEPLKLVSDAVGWELEKINSLEGFFA
jgi:DNA polymerase elongation subunit (family B)